MREVYAYHRGDEVDGVGPINHQKPGGSVLETTKARAKEVERCNE